MAIYKIIVAYDGTAYHGWQYQTNNITVAQILQDTFFSVFKCKIVISGASRTDAGVHAFGQVASFALDMQIAPETVMFAWNNVLPCDIVIRHVFLMPSSFNPRHNVVSKTYQYTFFLDRPMPQFQRYGWYFSRAVSIDTLQQALQVFVGTHDFRSFCTGYDMHSTIRRIDSVAVEFDSISGGYKIIIKGPGFLRYMIRRIVGACLTVASRENLQVSDLVVALEKKDPEQTLPSSPAKGLLLYEIVYEESMKNRSVDEEFGDE